MPISITQAAEISKKEDQTKNDDPYLSTNEGGFKKAVNQVDPFLCGYAR
jgi:hypothetical protein